MRAPQESAYFLWTERLGFRLWTEADSELSWDLWGDARVTRHIGGPFSREQVQQRLVREISTVKMHGMQYWPIFLLATGEHVGCCGLRPYRLDEKIYEIGCHLKNTFWGQGYGVEAARAVIAYAFDTLGAAGLFAGHNPAHETSRRQLEKLGFKYTHDEPYAATGLNHPSYMLDEKEFRRKSQSDTTPRGERS